VSDLSTPPYRTAPAARCLLFDFDLDFRCDGVTQPRRFFHDEALAMLSAVSRWSEQFVDRRTESLVGDRFGRMTAEPHLDAGVRTGGNGCGARRTHER
jgi:hypothetical protein